MVYTTGVHYKVSSFHIKRGTLQSTEFTLKGYITTYWVYTIGVHYKVPGFHKIGVHYKVPGFQINKVRIQSTGFT